MHLHEAVIISGSLQYCSYTGYSDGLTYAGDPKTKLSHQAKKRGDVVLAIDACFFQSYPVQFKEDFIKREFFKLHAGLMPLDSEADGNRLKFATGAWGCGAFGGIPQVKAIIQLILSSYHKRDLLYYHVGAERRISPQSLANLHKLLVDNDIRVGKLASWLKSYEKKGWDRVDLFSFIANQVLKDKEKLASFQLENEIGSVAKMLGTKDDGEDDESSDT
jgi:poly(ADP-ribose) glycohydrolase